MNGKRKASKGEIHSVAVVIHTRNGIGEKDMPAKRTCSLNLAASERMSGPQL
jgi:hypothetical protein